MSEVVNDPLIGQPSLIGQQLANFRIDGVIKKGGMSQVYYGWDVMLRRPVAIKVIDARFQSQESYAERFLREARVVASWWHEHITQIYYADKKDGYYYFVMEYVDGLDLKDLMAQYAKEGELLSHADVLKIGRAVASALDYAHSRNIIHRDVKPSNIMVSADGRVLLTDFGLALAIDEGSKGEIFGTPHYIAPEQAVQSANAVPQSDLYSLAVILFEMLVGVLPFQADSPVDLALLHVQKEPPRPRSLNPALSTAVESVLLKALSKSPKDRYLTGSLLIEALSLALQTTTTPGDNLLLPPLPPGMNPADFSRPMPTLSQVSVVDKIALQVELDKRLPTASSRQRPSKRIGLRMLGLALVLTSIVGLAALALWQSGKMNVPLAFLASPTATATATATATPSPTETTTATATAQPTETRLPTETAVPSETFTPAPTNTPVIIIVTATAAVVPSPTAVIIGDPVRFFYDANSFYVWNQTGHNLAIGNLSFLALDNNGTPLGLTFSGRDWAKIYPTLETNKCSAILPSDAPSFLNPASCKNYNATLTPSLTDSRVFWTSRRAAEWFSVYWNGQEIGRCPVFAGQCDLKIPTE